MHEISADVVADAVAAAAPAAQTSAAAVRSLRHWKLSLSSYPVRISRTSFIWIPAISCLLLGSRRSSLSPLTLPQKRKNLLQDIS